MIRYLNFASICKITSGLIGRHLVTGVGRFRFMPTELIDTAFHDTWPSNFNKACIALIAIACNGYIISWIKAAILVLMTFIFDPHLHYFVRAII
jgi:hypothetical protein